MANEVEIVVRTTDKSNFDQLQGNAKKAAGGLKSTFADAGKVAGGILIANLSQQLIQWGASAGRFLLDGVGVFNDTQEALSKVNAVFGRSSQEIDKWAKQGAKSFGLSRREALDAAGSFGNMFDQLGFTQKASTDMSTAIVELGADFASFHNADITDVLDAQSAAFRGEYDSLQRFLPLINAATVEERALELTGKATNKELTAQDKALAVNTLMFEGAGKARGDFAKTSEGAANQERILAAELENAQAALGEKLAPLLLKVTHLKLALVEAITTHLIPAIETATQWVRDNLGPAFEFLTQNGELLQPILIALGTVLAAVVLPALVSVAAAAIAAAAPFIALGIAVAAIAAAFIYAYNNSEPFRAAVDALVEVLGRAFDAAVKFLESIDWEKLWRDVQPTLEQARDLFLEFADKVGEVILQIIDYIEGIDWVQLWADVEPTLTQVWEIFQKLGTLIEETMQFILDVIGPILDTIQAYWSEFGDEILAYAEITWELIKGVISGALDIIEGVITAAIGLISGDWDQFWDGIKQATSGAIAIVEAAVTAFVDTIKNLIGGLKDFISGLDIWGGLNDGLEGQKSIAANGVAQINGIIAGINKVQSPFASTSTNSGGGRGFGGRFDSVGGGSGGNFNTSSSSGPRAHGGMSGPLNTVAENGLPELLSFQGGGEVLALPAGTRVHSGDRTAQMLGGGGTTIVNNINVIVHGSLLSDRDLTRKIRDQAYRGSLDGVGGVS